MNIRKTNSTSDPGGGRWPFRHLAALIAATVVAIVSVGAIALAAPTPTWTTLAPAPGGGAEGMYGAVVGNQIIGAYGDQAGFGDSTLTRIYNIDTNTWSMGAPAPGPPRAEGIGVAHGGIVYAIGGRSFVGLLGDVDAYNVATDTWTTLAPMPTPRAGLGAAVVGNAIYAIGGRLSAGGPCSGPAIDTVERYDIASNTWTTVASLPVPLSDAGATTMGGKVYVFGGCDGFNGTVNTVYVYDPNSNTWSAGAPMPRARAGFYQVGTKGNNVYVMGGLDFPFAGFADPAVDVYNVAKASWSTLAAPMPQPRGEMVVASTGGSIFAVSGSVPAYGNTTDTNAVLKP